METHVLLYDADCRLCTFAARAVRAVDFHRHIRTLPIQSPEATGLLRSIPKERRSESMRVVDPGGAVSSAGQALASLAGALAGRRVRVAVERSPRLTRTFQGMYATLAKVRGSPTCAVNPRAST